MKTVAKVLVAAGLAVAAHVDPYAAQADGPADEQQFLQLIQQLPMAVLPAGKWGTSAGNLAGGYRACAAMDQYPDDSVEAAKVYFSDRLQPGQSAGFEQLWFMRYASTLLCDRHAAMYDNL